MQRGYAMAVSVPTDEEVRQRVAEELRWDDRVDGAEVNVEVHEGRVVLSGRVPTYTARRIAAEDAEAVVGAGEVENRLVVKHPTALETPTDDEIESILTNMLRWDSDIDASDIRITADAGWVTLKGAVPAYWQKLKAEDLAVSVKGVPGVTNELAVVPSRRHEDRKIAEEIVAALERNVYVNADRVDVKVNEGVVTLTGTVPDKRAYRATRDRARYTPGVVDVINELVVEE
jgi:osmotically-inducible protein OsmY